MAKTKKIADKKLLEFYRQMVLIRRFEEATVKGYQQKKIAGFLHTYIGSEAVGVGALAHKEAIDSVVTTYRCHGLGLALGMDPKACMAELYGKITGCVRGKGGSMHYFSKEHNYLGGHGIVGGQFGIGIGAAFRAKYTGEKAVSFIHFGDGATPQGTFHETMNLASLWDLPAIFICEDNQYAMGTNKERILSNPKIEDLKHGYNVKGYTLDGMSLFETYHKFGEIVKEVRETSRPALVHVQTYRFKGHSVSDAALYRDKSEVEEWQARDPILEVSQYLLDHKIMSEEDINAFDKQIKNDVKDYVKFAQQSPEPPLEELEKHTYFDDVGAQEWRL
jgi:pyruvate dehydrogenase E1 component alpha subunit